MGQTLDYAPTSGTTSPRLARLSLALLLGINLFNYVDRYILAAVEPEIRKEFFKSAATSPSSATARDELMVAMAKTGSLFTAFLVSYMITAPIFGWLADRMNRWVLVGLAVGIWSLASGASGLAGTFAALMITRCFVGIGEGGYGPAAPAIISQLYPVKRRGAVLAWFYMAIPVGTALGYMFGGLVAGMSNWRMPFFLVVAPGMVLAVLCFFMKDPRGTTAHHASKPKARLKDYLAILKVRSYVLDTAGMTAMTFAVGGFSFWMPAYLVDQAHVGAGTGASTQEILGKVNFYFGAIAVIAGVSATLIGGWLGDYFRRHTSGSYFIVSATGIMLSVVCLWTMMHTSFPAAWWWLFWSMFFLFLNTGPSNAVLANVTTSSVRANAFALNILLIHALGDAISPPILGAIVGKFNWNAALYVVCAVMMVASLLWFWGARYLAADTEAAVHLETGMVEPRRHGDTKG